MQVSCFETSVTSVTFVMQLVNIYIIKKPDIIVSSLLNNPLQMQRIYNNNLQFLYVSST